MGRRPRCSQRPCYISCWPEFVDETIDLFEDNQGAIRMMENPIGGRMTVGVDVYWDFTGELIERNALRIQYTDSRNQHAGYSEEAALT